MSSQGNPNIVSLSKIGHLTCSSQLSAIVYMQVPVYSGDLSIEDESCQ